VQWAIAAALVLGAVSYVCWLAWPHFLLYLANRELNQIYRLERPFAYRWAGAPHGELQNQPHLVPATHLSFALKCINAAAVRFEQTNTKTLQLWGRAALLSGSYDEAIAKERLATLIDPENADLKMDLGIAFALRARFENRPLDYEFALEQMLQSIHISSRPEFLFSSAYLMEEFSIPSQAAQTWKEMLAKERDRGWVTEAQGRLRELRTSMAEREQRMQELTKASPDFVPTGRYEPGSSEAFLSEAIEHWLPVADKSLAAQKALASLAAFIEQENNDSWLLDLLEIPQSPLRAEAFQQLSIAWASNLDGNHIRAGVAALKAESLFQRLGNQAGILRSQVERAYSLDRRWLERDCIASVKGVRAAAASRHYRWIEGQAWLEEIACETETRKSDVIAQRVSAMNWISQTGFESLRLRALSFLTESYGGLDSHIKVWGRGDEGLRAYWRSVLPANRGYTFYYTLATSARSAGDRQAALVLLREGVEALKDFRYRQLEALALSDLGAWESEEGNFDTAHAAFIQMEQLFNHLQRQESDKFWREGQITMAEAELQAGQKNMALSRLQKLIEGQSFPYSDYGPTERRRLLPVLGSAYLGKGDLESASRFYEQMISESTHDLNSLISHSQRDNALREVAPAWRGLTEVYLRSGKEAEALRIWEAFRSSRLHPSETSWIHTPRSVTLLTYAFLQDGLSGWVAWEGGIEHRNLQFSEALKREAARFSELIADPQSPMNAVTQSAQRLYAALIQPFSDDIAPDTVLVIDPDGPLAAIPWLALQDASGHALIERFAVAQVHGWTEVAPLEANAVDLNQLLIFGAPILSDSLAAEYPPLVAADREARLLHHELPNSNFFDGHDATSANLSANLAKATAFYFAGHGVSFGGFGALLLANTPSATSVPQLMSAEQLATMRLPRLQLAVLAACSSGIGERSGEVNLDSLVQGFLEAGTHQVIASRATVDSQETADLMEDFFGTLRRGARPAEALREAALNIRQKAPHPYYWAGFQVFGNQ
jgi:CHAT domain-containing protein